MQGREIMLTGKKEKENGEEEELEGKSIIR